MKSAADRWYFYEVRGVSCIQSDEGSIVWAVKWFENI